MWICGVYQVVNPKDYILRSFDLFDQYQVNLRNNYKNSHLQKGLQIKNMLDIVIGKVAWILSDDIILNNCLL